MKIEKVYQCECGLWSRKRFKFLNGRKAICICGKEMFLIDRIIKRMNETPEEVTQIENNNNFYTSEEGQTRHFCHTEPKRHGWKSLGNGNWKRVKYAHT